MRVLTHLIISFFCLIVEPSGIAPSISTIVLSPGTDIVSGPTTIAGDGTDADKAKANENGVKPTAAAVTVLCNSAQARLIAEYENSGNIQVSLAYRGKAENANVFLEAQEKYFGGK